MFAALLGYNPVQNLLAPSGVLKHLPARNVAVLTGRQFFPNLISAPFHHGLMIVFTAAAIMAVAGALVSMLRGKQFYYDDKSAPALTLPPVNHKRNIPNGHSLTSRHRDSPAVADDSPVADDSLSVAKRDPASPASPASPRRGGSA
jgi:hypothetical protein